MTDLIDMKTAKDFKIVNKTATVAEITIYGEIGPSIWGDTISAKQFTEDLNKLPDSIKEINVRINSGGGDVFDGIVIYNRLKQHKARVIAWVDGMAASIASIIMLAADEVIFSEGAMAMIHKPWTGAYGNSNDFEDVISRLDDIEDQLINIYRRKTGSDRAEIRKLMSETTWFDATQAIEAGLADKKMEEDEVVNFAASIHNENLPWLKNGPKLNSGSDFVKKEVNNLFKEVEDFIAR